MKYPEIAINRSEFTQKEVENILDERGEELSRIQKYLSQKGNFTATDSETLLKLIETDTELIRNLFSKLGYAV